MLLPWAQRGKCLRALSDREFQVVVLDFSLPDADGLELVSKTRTGGRQKQRYSACGNPSEPSGCS
jgi:DNA-binding response OmpR family regulator